MATNNFVLERAYLDIFLDAYLAKQDFSRIEPEELREIIDLGFSWQSKVYILCYILIHSIGRKGVTNMGGDVQQCIDFIKIRDSGYFEIEYLDSEFIDFLLLHNRFDSKEDLPEVLVDILNKYADRSY